MKTIRLITCDSISEAHFIKGRLVNEGIDCFLTNQNFTTLMPIYNNMLGSGIQIYVSEKDFVKSRDIIKDKITPSAKNLKCPFCKSNDIRLGFGKNKGFKVFNITLSVFAAIPLGNIKPKYYCNKCKEEIK